MVIDFGVPTIAALAARGGLAHTESIPFETLSDSKHPEKVVEAIDELMTNDAELGRIKRNMEQVEADKEFWLARELSQYAEPQD